MIFYIQLVETFLLDLMTFLYQNQWSTVFCGIVSRAMTLDILSTGVAGNYNGALQVVIYNQKTLKS